MSTTKSPCGGLPGLSSRRALAAHLGHTPLRLGSTQEFWSPPVPSVALGIGGAQRAGVAAAGPGEERLDPGDRAVFSWQCHDITAHKAQICGARQCTSVRPAAVRTAQPRRARCIPGPHQWQPNGSWHDPRRASTVVPYRTAWGPPRNAARARKCRDRADQPTILTAQRPSSALAM